MIQPVALEGVDNFRDFGGYATSSGGRLRAGLLYRSASHGRATDGDLETIAALGIAVIVDLRRKQERARDPSRRHGVSAVRVIESDIGEEEEDSWLAHLAGSDLTETSFRAYMMDYYAHAPFNARIIDLYRRYFEELARGDGPILIHCAAGKDRTGILAALTHHVAGVGREDMMADYLATNDPVRLDRRQPGLTETIREITGRTPDPGAVRVAMSVEAAYLETALAAMDERHGGIDGYLEGALRLDRVRRRALAARLLE